MGSMLFIEQCLALCSARASAVGGRRSQALAGEVPDVVDALCVSPAWRAFRVCAFAKHIERLEWVTGHRHQSLFVLLFLEPGVPKALLVRLVCLPSSSTRVSPA